MKKIYFLSGIAVAFALAGCSKDFLKRYDDRITGGVWELVDVDRLGGGSTSRLPFRNGKFIFYDDGRMDYINSQGEQYRGDWDIRRNWHDDRNVRSLRISMVNFNTQDVLSEFFDEIVFTGTNRFKAYVYSGVRGYVYRFRR